MGHIYTLPASVISKHKFHNLWIILRGCQDLNSRIIELVNDKREWNSNEAIVTNSKLGVRLKGLTKTTESLNHDSLCAGHYLIQPKALPVEPTCLLKHKLN
jgi:hypothetical protein